MDLVEAARPVLDACLKCMKANIVSDANLAHLKMDVRGCHGDAFCVQAKIRPYISQPCHAECRTAVKQATLGALVFSCPRTAPPQLSRFL